MSGRLDPIQGVRSARKLKERADLAYLDAMLRAKVAGYSNAEIARAAGVSRQAVHQVFSRRA